MNVIKYFFKNAKANKIIFVMYIFIFVIILFLSTAGNIQRQGTIFEPTKSTVGLIKNSDDEVADAVEEYLRDYLGADTKLDLLPDDLGSAKELIYMGNYDAIVRIPENCKELFEQDKPTVQVIFSPLGFEGHIIDNRMKVFLMMYRATEQNGQYDMELTKKILKKEAKVEFLKTEQTPEHELQRLWVKTFFNTSGYILMAIYISLIGMSMSGFNEPKTKKRIAISSKDDTKMQMEIYMAQLLMGALITSILVGVCFAFKGSQLFEHQIGKYILNLGVYSIVVMALTFLLNNFTNNRHTKNVLSTVLSLGLAFISGVFLPQTFLSAKVLAVAKFFPLYYFVIINETVHPEVSFMIRNLGIQMLFGILFFVMGLYFARKKRIAE